MKLKRYNSYNSMYSKNFENSNFQNSTITNSTPPFKNPFGNLIGGLVEEMASGENRVYTCFPDDWINGPNSKTENSNQSIGGNFSKIAENLKVLVNLGAPIIDFFCKYKEKIIMFVQGFFVKKSLRKFRLLIESGKELKALKLLKRRFGWVPIPNGNKNSGSPKGIISSWLSNTFKQVGNFVNKNLINPLFNTFVAPIQKNIMYLVNGFKSFFTGGFMTRIENCMNALSTLKGKFEILFKGLKAKFDLMRTSMGMGLPGTIVFFTDFLIAMICEHKSLTQAVDFILKSFDMADTNHHNFNLGRGIGIFLKTLSFAPTVTGKVLSNSKFKRLYFK